LNKQLQEMLTIVIPTKNRSDFFLRLLPYYRDQSFSHKIMIADSSTPESVAQTKRVIDSAGSNLKIEHRLYDAEISYVDKISDALTRVQTPFSLLGADDDFFVPSGLDSAARFLSEHSDYAVAHGEAFTFEVKDGAVFGAIEKVNRYDQRTIDQSTAIERLAKHFSLYTTTYYSVHRTDRLRGNLQKRLKSDTDLAFGELMAGAFSLIQGKAKKLDALFMVRQGFVPKEYEKLFDVLDWIATPGWGEQYERFRDCLVEELYNLEGVEGAEAREIIKSAFSDYLSSALKPRRPSALAESKVKEAMRAVPGARQVWRGLRSLHPKVNSEINLPALLRPSSIYHAEFMPIYRAITAPAEDLKVALSERAG
jgi:glycosyltransferase domain-containing protein